MSFFKEKNYRQSILSVLTVVVSITAIAVIIYLMSFLVSNLNLALNVKINPTNVKLFDISGFEKLNLIKK